MGNPLAALYLWWMSTPAPIRAPITSGVLSLVTAGSTALGIAYGDQAFNPPSNFVPWLQLHALNALIGAIVGGTVGASIRTNQVLKNNPVTTTPPPPA